MMIDHAAPIDLNVRIAVYNEHGELVRDSRYKNTATKRMTTGIALFLAGDQATYENRTLVGQPPSGLGRWRPNFISFATTGIDRQPTSASGLATVNDPDAFENKNPLPGERTRPWFDSKYLGEHSDGFWKPAYGWGTPAHPNVACFQGELATALDRTVTEDVGKTTLRRHQILRADVTTDNSWEREMGQEGYSTDCILYGYSSVTWTNQFFKPEHGPELKRIAISEIGLYEMNSDTPTGRPTLMAGFRVPSVDDIIYVSPNYVIMVEWRITIRALMPYEGVVDITEPTPTGISVRVFVIDDHHAQMEALVHGPSLVSQAVTWSLTGQTSSDTTLTQDGHLTIGELENADALYVRVESTKHPEIYAVSAVIPGIINNVVTGISLTAVSVAERRVQLQATVLGKGTFPEGVSWRLEGQTSTNTRVTPAGVDNRDGIITIGADEEATGIKVIVTSTGDTAIKAAAAILRIDKTTGDYIISDFTILTGGD